MEILPILLLCLSVSVSAQYYNRNQDFRNPGFHNVRTPLATSASKDRPFISIPIVLLPDGQQIPMPKQTTYHYVGNAAQNSPRQNSQRNQKQRGSVSGRAAVNYQVSITASLPQKQPKKTVKLPKLSTAQLSSHLKNAQSNFPRGRGPTSQQNRNVQPQFEQNPNVFQSQLSKQQKSPAYQQQRPTSEQPVAAHKQNVANFVNFATSLGSSVASQHQHQSVILPTQTPSSSVTFHNHQNIKQPEGHLPQRPLLENHKLTGGVTFQHQVPSLANTQGYNIQMVHHNQNTAYSIPQQQNQYLLKAQQQQHSSSNPQISSSQPQHQESISQSQYQQGSSHQQSNAHSQYQQASSHPQHQQANSHLQHQQSSSQLQHQQSSSHPQQQQHQHEPSTSYSQHHTQSQHSPHQLSQHVPGSQPQLSNPQQQHPVQNSHGMSPSGNYASISNLRQNAQQGQGSASPTSVTNSATQASVLQLNNAAHLHTQTSPQQNNALLLSNYNGHHAQNNQQNFAVAQPNHIVSPYNSQSPLSKTALQSHAEGSTADNQNTNSKETSYTSQNHQSYPQAHVTLTGTLPSSSGYPIDQIAEINSFALQSAHSGDGQFTNPLSYFQYQAGQEIPFSLGSFLGQGQTSYISAQSAAQEDPVIPSVDQSYTLVPNTQSLYVSSGQSVFSSPQDETPAEASLVDVGLQSYDSYNNAQSGYASSATSQVTHNSFISSPEVEKNYQNDQYAYLQSQQSPSVSISSDGQGSQSSTSVGSGPLIYASTTSKQINYSPASSTGSQQQSSNPSSPTYVSFTTAAGSSFKSDTPTSLNYGQRSTGVVTPGSTYAKVSAGSEKKQVETASDASEASEDEEDDEEDAEEGASYKVVYIPLDILKNILSNSVENQ